jgi:hypothetical protein
VPPLAPGVNMSMTVPSPMRITFINRGASIGDTLRGPPSMLTPGLVCRQPSPPARHCNLLAGCHGRELNAFCEVADYDSL